MTKERLEQLRKRKFILETDAMRARLLGNRVGTIMIIKMELIAIMLEFIDEQS